MHECISFTVEQRQKNIYCQKRKAQNVKTQTLECYVEQTHRQIKSFPLPPPDIKSGNLQDKPVIFDWSVCTTVYRAKDGLEAKYQDEKFVSPPTLSHHNSRIMS